MKMRKLISVMLAVVLAVSMMCVTTASRQTATGNRSGNTMR